MASELSEQYKAWISEHVEGDGYGQCRQATEDMAKEFPELKRVRGHYFDSLWGKREHWWLVDPEGNIVDPTAMQFPTKGTNRYVPWREGDPEPIGQCYNCGDYVFNKDYNGACSEDCEKAIEEETRELNQIIQEHNDALRKG